MGIYCAWQYKTTQENYFEIVLRYPIFLLHFIGFPPSFSYEISIIDVCTPLDSECFFGSVLLSWSSSLQDVLSLS